MAAIEWTEAQKKAVDLHGSNILVSAAAGSGKTAVLVERVIRMLTRTEDPVDIDDLVVMTFTRAAAAQMKSKIYSALREKLSEDPDNLYLKKQLMKIQGARILTIDSLCLDIVRNNIQDVDLDPGFRMAEDTEIRLLEKDVLRELIEAKYKEASSDFLDFAEYYTDKNDNRIEDIILKLYRFAASHPEPLAYLRACTLSYINAENLYADENTVYPADFYDWKASFADIVNGILEEILDMAEEGIRTAEMNYGPEPFAEQFRDIIAFVNDLSGKCFDYRADAVRIFLDNWPKAPRISTKDGETDETLKKHAADLRNKIKDRLTSLRDDYLYADLTEMFNEIAACKNIAVTITDITGEFIEALNLAKKEKRIADFSDIAHYALEILIRYNEDGEIIRDENNEPVYTETADNMARQTAEIIVDEYQDTNMLQDYLIKALSAERFGRPDVFMVGDIKQSIYGFRMACPELFNKKYNSYIYNDPEKNNSEEEPEAKDRLIILDKNFRSRKEILDISNLVFMRSMIPETGGIDYRNGHELRYGETYGKVAEPDPRFKTCINMIQGKGEQGKLLEAYTIASGIETLVKDEGYSYNDIVILTRTTNNPELEKILYERKIPVINNSGRGFFQSFEIRLILDLLRIIDNPFQDIPFAAVLYSPLCGASAEDLASVRLSGDEKDSLYECLIKYNEKNDKFTGFTGNFEKWRHLQSRMSLYHMIGYILEDSGLYNMITAMPEGENRKANILFLRSRALSFSKGSYSGIFDFIRYIKELEDSDIDFGQAEGLRDDMCAVRMMTIHKSKGLEFPVVFLAGCGKKYNETDINSGIVLDRRLGIGIERRDPGTRMIKRTILMQTIRSKQKENTFAEEMRLLYVAMTRAKERLIISGVNHRMLSDLRSFDSAVSNDSGPLKPYRVMAADSFLSLLGMTLYGRKEEGILYDIVITDETGPEEKRADEIADNLEDEFILNNIINEDIDTSDIEKQCNYRYPYLNAANIRGKITASMLEDKEEEPGEYERAKGKTKGHLSGADRGNAYHRFLELTDYSPDIKAQLEKMKAEGKIDHDQAESVDEDLIRSFFDSDVGKRMAAAHKKGRLFRETQFVKGDMVDINRETTKTGPGYISDVPDEELLLVQGIIDAWFTEEDEYGNERIVLVDYKTDRVLDREHYIRTYTPQLEEYAEAIRRCTGRDVSERIIYAFELREEIKL